MKFKLTLLSLLAIYSCIGTDYTEEALILNEASVNLTPKSFNIALGQSLQLTANVKNIKGETVTASLNWESEQPAIATVDQNGKVESVSQGNTNIIVTYTDDLKNIHKDTSVITIVEGSDAGIGGITLTSSTTTLAPSGSTQIQVEIRSTNGGIISLPVTWTSSKPEVATVNSNGNVTAIANGQTNISAEAQGVVSNQISILVQTLSELTGSFSGKTGHSVSGSTSVSKDRTSLVLEEDFKTQAGPGLHVYLGKSANTGTGGIDLGEIKSNSGRQTYSIPLSVNVNEFSHVLVYCKPFRVVFGAAELK